MSIKSKIVKISVCCAIVAVPVSQTNLPVFAAEQTGLTASQDNVNIPDAVFKEYLNGMLGQASTANITEAQMNTLTSISLSNLNITDLTGLEYAHNLKFLTINSIKANNYNQIKELSNLENMIIMGSNITSDKIPDLNQLQKLKNIDLSHSNHDDSIFSKFANLPNVTRVNLSYNGGITDIMALKTMPELVDLNIQYCGVHDYRGIEEFPKLHELYAYGQTIGGVKLVESTIKSNKLTYDAAKETMYVPFSLMTSRTINYDGYTPDFTKATERNNTNFTMNGKYIDGSRLTITSDGLTVSGVSKTDFDELEKMEYNARVDVSYGTYNIPDQFSNGGSYTISGAIYDHYFTVDHSLAITADQEASYLEGESKTEAEFLADVHATTDDGSSVTSDFANKVDMNKPGEYTVTLQAENNAGLKANPVQVKVTVAAKTVITADKKITYKMPTNKTEEEFLQDIHAKTNDNSTISSNFKKMVDFSKPGEYIVTLNAENSKQKAEPIEVTVVIEAKTPIENPTPQPDPDPQPQPKPDSNPIPTIEPKTPTHSDLIVQPDSADSKEMPVTITKEKADVKNSLPKTGDSIPLAGITLGSLLIGLSFIVSRKK